MTTPTWALSLAYWLHMLATVAWIGGLTALGIFVLPAARKILTPADYATLLVGIRRRFDPVGWFSLLLLVGTGMLQMSANSNYSGFLAIDNRWAVAIFLKHVLFLAMAALSAYLSWGLLPRLQRLALRRAHLQTTDETGLAQVEQITAETSNLERMELTLLRVNFLLGVLVLALTAIARAT